MSAGQPREERGDYTRVDEQTVMQRQRATAAENEPDCGCGSENCPLRHGIRLRPRPHTRHPDDVTCSCGDTACRLGTWNGAI